MCFLMHSPRVGFVFFLLTFQVLTNFLVIFPGTSFRYCEGTLVLETKQCSFNLTLAEGFHILVIENTGYSAGEYYRNRPTAAVEYTVFLREGGSLFPDVPVSYELSLDSQEYLWLNLSSSILLGGYSFASVSVVASNKVSVFMTDTQGFNEFREEVNNTTFTNRPLSPIIMVAVILGVGGVVVAIFILRFRSRKQTEALYQIGQFSSSQFTSSHKAPPSGPSSPLLPQAKQDIYNSRVQSLCDSCGGEVSINQEFCSICGSKLSK